MNEKFMKSFLLIQKSDWSQHQNFKLSDEALSTKKWNKTRKKILKKQWSKLLNFWYRLVNEQICLRIMFLNYFNEFQKFQNQIQQNCCCNNYNSDLHLDELNNHYLYIKHDNKLNNKHRKILKLITCWEENQVSKILLNSVF